MTYGMKKKKKKKKKKKRADQQCQKANQWEKGCRQTSSDVWRGNGNKIHNGMGVHLKSNFDGHPCL
jgi:hypothetical protein